MTQDPKHAAQAAGNAVIDAVVGKLLRELAQAEARAAGLAVQLDAMHAQLASLQSGSQEPAPPKA